MLSALFTRDGEGLGDAHILLLLVRWHNRPRPIPDVSSGKICASSPNPFILEHRLYDEGCTSTRQLVLLTVLRLSHLPRLDFNVLPQHVRNPP